MNEEHEGLRRVRGTAVGVIAEVVKLQSRFFERVEAM